MAFKDNLLKFLKANGIEDDPEVAPPRYQNIQDYLPSEQLVWHRGAVRISVALALVQENQVGALGLLEELQRTFGLPVGAAVSWQRITDGELSTPDPVAVNPIGFQVPKDMVASRPDLDPGVKYFFNVGPKFPEPGDTYKNAAGVFVAIAFGMFSRWWMKKG